MSWLYQPLLPGGAQIQSTPPTGGFTSHFGFWFGGMSSTPSSGFQPAWAANVNIILGAGNP